MPRAPSVHGDNLENAGAKKVIVSGVDPLEGKLLAREWVMFTLGCITGLLLFPLTATTVASTVLWDALDRGFRGRPQEGVVMTMAKWVTKNTEALGKPFVRNPKDAFLVHIVFLLGIVVPSVFFYSFWRTLNHGFDPLYCFMYHVFRLGPYFMNFAYCYALCHKEGHSQLGLFKGIFRKPMGVVFNWWIGLFYGVMPSTFVYGHSINHHKYNNGPHDVISTSDKPRDNFRNFMCYLPRFILYAVNISTIAQFFREGNYKVCIRMLLGNAWWAAWFLTFASFSPQFAFWYIVFPIGENALLLSCINWTWHAFLNPDDPEDEFVGSITILGGPIDVLAEDFHVVHHQYPGAHWSTHEQRYQHHLASGEYSKGPATVFKDTHAFEVFALVVLREYDELARKFVDMKGGMTHDEKKAILQQRLRACWWGPRRNLSVKLEGKELGNHHLGHAVQRDGIKED
eukprot:Hpha_TRINITY_DN15338_c0_g8::TRINITY_DN15338_c0_g8_i1::g.89038::m.89038